MAEEEGTATQAALASLAARYRNALKGFFHRRLRKDPHQCEDLTQEVFVRLARRQNARDIHNIEAYIFRTANSVLVDHLRNRAIRPEGAADMYTDDIHAPEDLSPECVLLGREEVERLMTAIETLPTRARQAILLFRFEGLKQADIALRMGISVSAVEKNIKLGMVRIAEALSDSE